MSEALLARVTLLTEFLVVKVPVPAVPENVRCIKWVKPLIKVVAVTLAELIFFVMVAGRAALSTVLELAPKIERLEIVTLAEFMVEATGKTLVAPIVTPALAILKVEEAAKTVGPKVFAAVLSCTTLLAMLPDKQLVRTELLLALLRTKYGIPDVPEDMFHVRLS